MIFTEDHDRFRRSVRGIVKREIAPYVDQWEEAGAFPGHQLFAALGQAGLFGVEYDPAYGGQGAVLRITENPHLRSLKFPTF